MRLAVLLILGLALASPAQMKLTVQQLLQFLRSSIQLKHEDKRVAEYLKKTVLTEQLDERTIEEMQGQGVGPKTLEAMRLLADASRGLPKAAPSPAKPAPVVIPPPSPEEQRRIIEEAREYALSYTKRLPDFICTQVTRRYLDPTGLEFWRKMDTVVTRLSFFERKEDYKVVLVDNRPTESDYHALGGAISAGEFGTMLREIFEPETQADFQWTRWATLRSRRHHVYSYRVSQPRSKWSINYQNTLRLTPGYRGLVYLDRDSVMVSKVTLEADGIPPSFPVQTASSTLDYELVMIGDQQHMLPLRSEMRMRETKLLMKNEVEFRMYRKFGAEATITFTPDRLPEEATKELPPKP